MIDNRLRLWFSSYNPLVWWIVIATGFTKLTQFMVLPFVALYMSAHTNATPGIIGLAIGMNALTSTVFGYIGGWLADKYGRKMLMVTAMLINVMAMTGFANAHTIWFFFLISAMSGMSRAFFGPTSKTMLGDVTPEDRRAAVFAMNYWALNVGAALGPILGGYFGTVATGWTFYVAAAVSFVYGAIIFFIFPESKPNRVLRTHQSTFSSTLTVVARDKVLLWFLLGSVIEMCSYAQIDTTLPQLLGMQLGTKHGGEVFSIVLASNAVGVVLLQVWFAKIGTRIGPVRSLMYGQALFALGYVGFAFASSLWSFVFSMFFVTSGEMLAFPSSSVYISNIAGEDLRATYFGANSLGKLGSFLGPWLGGILLHMAGGTVLYITVALLSLIAIPCYRLSNRAHVFTKNSTQIGLKETRHAN